MCLNHVYANPMLLDVCSIAVAPAAFYFSFVCQRLLVVVVYVLVFLFVCIAIVLT